MRKLYNYQYIPELSSKDIENYLMILVAQKYMKQEKFELLLNEIYEKKLLVSEEKITFSKMNELTNSIDNAFINEQEYKNDIDVISKVKEIISTVLKGNPRQAKRFLNTFMVKKKLAECYYGDEIDIKILAKLLVLQKIKSELFSQLNNWNKNFTTKNEEFEELLQAYRDKTIVDKFPAWDLPQIEKWLECEPVELQKEKLDKYFYLTREMLKENIIDYSNISTETKVILEKIGKATKHNINSVIEEMSLLPREIVRESFSVLLPQIKSGKNEMYIVEHLFESFNEYQGSIIEQLTNGDYIFKVPDLPYWKKMYNTDNKKITECLEKMKESSRINETNIDIIKGG